MFKVVFQIPYNEDIWDDELANELRVETPGNPHGTHINIYPGQKDHETGERVTFIRCMHTNLKDLRKFIEKVFAELPEICDD